MRTKNIRKAMAKAWRWASVNQSGFWRFVVVGSTTLLFVVVAGYAIWCTSRSDEMRGRTSSLDCTTSWRGTTCLCGFRTGRKLFVPAGQLPTEKCGEDD